MKLSKTEVIEQYRITLLEIEKVKKLFNLKSLRRKAYQEKLESDVRGKIKNGTASSLDQMILYLKLDYFVDTHNPELALLLQRAKELATKIWGENIAFPNISDFLEKTSKRIKKLLKYLTGKLCNTYQSVEDKRPLISQFRKLLIKVNQDDVDNSTTHINMKINRVLNLNNKPHDDVIRYKESTYQHFGLQ